ncbi:hypothetical protein DIU31_028410 [Mucilaginibacter rubeus]|uniref:Uncharacterized protein n=1 Tax=Mucilaginibacter rubeus TaxID=2027860 RepID=A0AAE6JKY4_9SPHI|nr:MULTISPECIES: hypothetical protein [Mucilaginibacter]QEM07231.1 hypothetical protein DIU31_028410 [Mucilaginibacter rubeus]QEM19686.1 hypothetical protein DIU38_027980 [Mucilaginibacter gossypii]QTE43616.1 hypothetical protein J3L19_32640 [Mucilaginibacter rubeus]QTE50216.1 hypothetical protein J3L21_32595 [Mucilaginibacter rubeus]QTE55304.1 hypothetical protein J3L23_24215 [Mucilaginibacter rubeus]
MKFLTPVSFTFLLLWQQCNAQSVVKDQSIRYQQERMVFLQWDQKKFTPTPGFLHLNPYYWLTWGLFHPDYHKNDLRPLCATGPQTQRLALVAAMNATDNKYKLQSDTLRNTELSEVANQSGTITDFDPLWQLYYGKKLKPVLNYNSASILSGLSPQVSAKLVSEGLYNWYINELDMLKERVSAAHSTTMDRGARIMAYHRYLMEYRQLAAVWTTRTSSAQATINMTAQQQRLKSNLVGVPDWTPQSDIQIANKVLQHVQ